MTFVKQLLAGAIVAGLVGLVAYFQGHPDVASWTLGGAIAALVASIMAKIQGK